MLYYIMNTSENICFKSVIYLLTYLLPKYANEDRQKQTNRCQNSIHCVPKNAPV